MKRPQRVEAIKVFGIDAESLKNIRISFYGAELKDLGGRSPRRKERKVEGKHELLVAENFSGAHRDFIVYCLPPIEGVRAIEIRKFPPYNENYKLSLRRVQVLATNLEEIDKDLDRKLEELNMTEKKIEAVVESHFKLLDKDSDNRLRKEEVQRVMAEIVAKIMEPWQPQRSPGETEEEWKRKMVDFKREVEEQIQVKTHQMFASLDTDGDNKLSKKEFSTLIKCVFVYAAMHEEDTCI